MSVTSEIAAAAFSLSSMKLCDRGVLPSTDLLFGNFHIILFDIILQNTIYTLIIYLKWLKYID